MSGRGRSGGYGSGGGSGGGGISSIAGLTASAITASQLKTALAIATGDVIGFTADAAAAAPVQSVAGMTGAPTAAQVKTALAIATGDVAGFAAAAAAAAPVQSVAGLTGAPTAAQIKTALAIATGDVAGFIAAAAAAAPVQSVAGLTGAPTAVQVKTALAIATGDVAGFTAAAASAAPVQSVAGLTGAPTAAQVKTALAIDASDIVTGTLAIARLGDGTIPASKLVNMANGTIRGRISAGSGAPEDLTVTQLKTLLAYICDVVVYDGPWSGRPSAASAGAGAEIRVTFPSGTRARLWSDGTNWRAYNPVLVERMGTLTSGTNATGVQYLRSVSAPAGMAYVGCEFLLRVGYGKSDTVDGMSASVLRIGNAGTVADGSGGTFGGLTAANLSISSETQWRCLSATSIAKVGSGGGGNNSWGAVAGSTAALASVTVGAISSQLYFGPTVSLSTATGTTLPQLHAMELWMLP